MNSITSRLPADISVLESEFMALLQRLHPEKDAVSSFPKIAAKAWADRMGATDKETKRLTTRLEDQKRLKNNLLRAFIAGSIAKADYGEANAEFAAEISVTVMELEALDAKCGIRMRSFTSQSCTWWILRERGRYPEEISGEGFKISCLKMVCTILKKRAF